MEPDPSLAYRSAMNIQHRPVGEHLRSWRQRRRKSQLDLACQAEISTRHLSFLETGRALPSREMILHLAGELEIPMRERNLILVAAGYAPIFPERRLDDPALDAARAQRSISCSKARSLTPLSPSTGTGELWRPIGRCRSSTKASRNISCSRP